MIRISLVFALSSVLGIFAYADEKSVQPYIDQLRSEMNKKGSVERSVDQPDPYIQSIKKKMPADASDGSTEPYIDSLKKLSPETYRSQDQKGYTEQEKSKLEPKKSESAIQAVMEGHSELHPKKKGNIHNAVGFRIGPATTRNITANAETQNGEFNSIYGNSWAPDLTFFYEFQPFRSEWLGNVGVVASAGLSLFRGKGVFALDLPNPAGGSFSRESQTKFVFYSFPISVGLNYRFNLMRILRPYVLAGPALIGYMESRDDSKAGNKGFAKGFSTALGVAISLDWLSPKNSWDLYSQYGFKQNYLTLEYSRMFPFLSDVSFAYSGINLGIAFEY